MPSVVTVDPDITEFKTDYSATSGEHHKEYGTIGWTIFENFFISKLI